MSRRIASYAPRQAAKDQAAKAETELKSPVAGEVVKVLGRVGEISPQGVPVVTVANMADQWVVLNVREDKLDKFGVGKEFDGTLPALKGRKVRFKVYRAAVQAWGGSTTVPNWKPRSSCAMYAGVWRWKMQRSAVMKFMPA